MHPLFSVAPTSAARKALTEIGESEDAERESDSSSDPKRDTCKAILDLTGKNRERLFTIQDVMRPLQAQGYSNDMINEQKIGRILSELGCMRTRKGSGNNRKRFYMLAKQNRSRLIREYGIRDSNDPRLSR
jgi:hypothetical protein